MIEYHSNCCAWLGVHDRNVEQGKLQARKAIGEDTWKMGWSKKKQQVTRDCLLNAGAEVIEIVLGRFTGFKIVVNRSDDGTEYRKVWVTLLQSRRRLFVGKDANGRRVHKDCGSKVAPEIVTMDVASEYAQRIIAKLAGVNLGDIIRLSCWPTISEPRDDGRTFVNHVASVQRMENGQWVEVKAPFPYVGNAGKKAQAAAEVLLQHHISSKMALWAARSGARADYFWKLSHKIADGFGTRPARPAIESNSDAGFECGGFA